MEQSLYDIVILGCGPAGLSAAVNARIRNKRVIIVGAALCSPPLHKAQLINNYLGLPGITGQELLDSFMDHVDKMNLERTSMKADSIMEENGWFKILAGEEIITTRSIIIATGIPYKETLPAEESYLGKGLGYCATCDGPLYRGKDIIIIAHSSEAEHEANFMAEICHKVYYLPLYKGIGVLDQRVEIIYNKPAKILGQEYVEGLVFKDNQRLELDGIFILGGETSPERLISGLELDDKHIKVNRQQETNIPGIFAAGDCTGAPYQVAKSVGEGQVAGLNAARYVSEKNFVLSHR
ncbi:NAD(P)/FAD-dependent oxidoreductase [Syntrophomonas palmitatica]|uniref:NAD(P)/FAD-dependent oxidoreductase n=1 Tax=Syntrophomonas palmitatica TaxID=402877 RepID=UPI0006D1283F|nr:NAD(P)/FAD-dependent oxidoreductase [Syntrophomonas palmitatica]